MPTMLVRPTASPVSDGEFPNGSEPMLWRPGLNHTRLRRRSTCAALLSLSTLYAAFGVVTVALGAQARTVTAALVCVVLGALVATLNVLRIAVASRCVEFDHLHGPDRPCFLDRTRGEYFYRPSDFLGVTPTAGHSAHQIIESVQLIHASPAAPWFAAHDLRDIHQVAWDVLSALDGSRSLRRALEAAQEICPSSDSAHAARARLDAIDGAIDDVISCLHQAVLLIHAWEEKLAIIDVQAKLQATLGTCGDSRIMTISGITSSLPQNMFAHVTAARDITHAGPFEWERPAHPRQAGECRHG